MNLTRQSAFGALHHLESQFTRHSLRASSPLILGELQEIAQEETQGAVSLTAPFAYHKWREQVITGCKTWRSIDSHPESNPQHHMGCVRPFKEGIGFSHHTGVCSKGQTHNLIPSALKRNRVQILYKKGLRFFQGFSPVGVWLFSLWGTSLFTIRSGDLRGVVGSPCTYNIKLKFWVTYILFVWYYTFSTTFQVRLLF